MRINGWQRLWAVVSTLLLLGAAGFANRTAPASDSAVLADLRSPACAIYRDLPDGFVLDHPPTPSEPCHALAHFRQSHTTRITSVDEYKAFQSREARNQDLTTTALWALLVMGLYTLGWSVAWIRRGFRKANAA